MIKKCCCFLRKYVETFSALSLLVTHTNTLFFSGTLWWWKMPPLLLLYKASLITFKTYPRYYPKGTENGGKMHLFHKRCFWHPFLKVLLFKAKLRYFHEANCKRLQILNERNQSKKILIHFRTIQT